MSEIKKIQKFNLERKLFELQDKFTQKLASRGIKPTLASELSKALFFVGAFAVLFFPVNFIVGFLPIEYFEYLIGIIVVGFLAFMGIESSIFFQEPVLIQAVTGEKIIISFLCTGILETIVYVAVVFASLGISFKKRLIGAIVGIGAIALLNITRILVTLVFILESTQQTIVFVHDILFRVVLFVSIAGFYAIWFWLATRRKN